jgi:hypothetical protein
MMRWPKLAGIVLAVVIAVLLGLMAVLPAELVDAYVSDDGQVQHALGLTMISLLVTVSYPRSWVWVLVLGTVASAAVELIQPIFGRGAQWSDLAADVAGLVIGVSAALSIRGLVRSYLKSR